MIGLGQRYPHCMQHQIANLRGSTDGSPPIDVGTTSGLHRFDGRRSRFPDDLRSWQTDEPALDMTGAAIAAAAAQLTRSR